TISYSPNGTPPWTDVPTISGPGALSADAPDGQYWTASSGLCVVTHHLTVFAIQTDRSAPSTPDLNATIVNGQLVLTWSAASDNSGSIAGYAVWVDGQEFADFDGGTLSDIIGPAVVGDTRMFRVQSIDPSGNRSELSNAVTGIPNLIGMTLKQALDALA